jgi:general secretion pathway protein B
MSLILEALRKSEAERQRAQAPGLHAPAPVHRPPTARPGWGPWVAVLIGAALLAGTWWVNRPAPPPVTPTVAAAPPPRTEPATASAPAEPALVEPPPAPVVPAPQPVPDPPADLGEPVEPPPAPVVVAPEPVAPPPPEPEPAPAEAPAPPTAEALPTLASLAPAERAALPPLKVSMFVWSQEPARRFAIVDGNRVGEGALLAGGTVAEIRPDGVVLELQGRRLLLARP